jgi:CRP-like cAMP-binding protein
VEQQPGKVLAHHGSGAVFGEMSFLMQNNATASVIAANNVEVSIMELAQVRERLDSTPGLAARFYQTLAVTLAHRLHKASRLLSQQEL